MRHLPHIPTFVLAFALALVAMVLCTDAAFAQAAGDVGSFSCSAGHANGQLYNSGTSCPTNLNMGNVFSFLVCNMEQLSSNLMGHMYCGMAEALTPAVWAVATLAVIFFGIAFTIGLVPATGRDAILFLLKIAFVTGFATNADLLIGVGYSFLINGMKDGVNIVLSGLGGAYTTGAGVYGALDGFLATALHYATDSLVGTTGDEKCNNAIFAVMATMSIAFPMISYLAIMLLARIAITFVRAVFSYVYALVGITFLLTLAPIFVPFFLFKPTRSFFDKWIAYMVSFALQVVLLFAFMAFILSIPAKSLTSNLTDIIVYKSETPEATAFRFPWEYCTLCEFKIVDRQSGAELTPQSPDLIAKGKLQCKDNPPKAISATFAMSPQSGKSELSSLLILATNGILAMLLLAVIVEQLLGFLPHLAQRLASALGATYSPELAGGKMPLPGENQMTDFSRGFTKGMGVYNDKGGINITGNGPTSIAQGVRDGLATMVTGKTTRGEDVKAGGLGKSGGVLGNILGTTRNKP